MDAGKGMGNGHMLAIDRWGREWLGCWQTFYKWPQREKALFFVCLFVSVCQFLWCQYSTVADFKLPEGRVVGVSYGARQAQRALGVLFFTLRKCVRHGHFKKVLYGPRYES